MKGDRKQPRTRANTIYLVFDSDSNSAVGRITDLSATGFHILSRNPMEDMTFVRCRISLLEPIDGHDEMFLSARSVWCEKSPSNDFYDIGFKIVRMSERNHALWKQCMKWPQFGRHTAASPK